VGINKGEYINLLIGYYGDEGVEIYKSSI